MKFHRRWPLVLQGYRQARGKKHGMGKETIYQSLVLGLMMRAIALRQSMNSSLFVVWGWRLVRRLRTRSLLLG